MQPLSFIRETNKFSLVRPTTKHRNKSFRAHTWNRPRKEIDELRGRNQDPFSDSRRGRGRSGGRLSRGGRGRRPSYLLSAREVTEDEGSRPPASSRKASMVAAPSAVKWARVQDFLG